MYEYGALCVNITPDGDLVLSIDLGFDVTQKETLPLFGIRFPEKTSDTDTCWQESQRWLQKKVFGARVVVKVHREYGRYLAEVFCEGDTMSVNQLLVAEGLAADHFGHPGHVV
jgi:endonuclease YncB( thermonuclease family)